MIERLCHALLSSDDAFLADMIEALKDEGVNDREIYLEYLAEAARMLGEWWEQDKTSFAHVTLGTSRLYGVMRAIHREPHVMPAADDRTAVFLALPGETHTLGVRMATDIFRDAGWTIDCLIERGYDELLTELLRRDPKIIGISAAGEHVLDVLSRLVVALRLKAPGTYLFVGGQIVECARDFVSVLDVDGMSSDVETAERLLTDAWEAGQS